MGKPGCKLGLMERKTFLEQLVQRQGNTSGRDFADRLGISESYWSLIRRGERSLSLTVIERALQEFPDLAPYFVRDLLPEPAASRRPASVSNSRRWRYDVKRVLVNASVAMLVVFGGVGAASGGSGDWMGTIYAAPITSHTSTSSSS